MKACVLYGSMSPGGVVLMGGKVQPRDSESLGMLGFAVGAGEPQMNPQSGCFPRILDFTICL